MNGVAHRCVGERIQIIIHQSSISNRKGQAPGLALKSTRSGARGVRECRYATRRSPTSGIRTTRDSGRTASRRSGEPFTSQPGVSCPHDEHSNDTRPSPKWSSESCPWRPQMNCRSCSPTRVITPLDSVSPLACAESIDIITFPLVVPPLVRTPGDVPAMRRPPSPDISREMPEKFCWEEAARVQRFSGECTRWRISRAARNSVTR